MERHAAVLDTIKRHRKKTIQGCACGWADIGKDHADHLAAAVEAALVGRDCGIRDLEELNTMVLGTLKLVGA